MAHVSNRRGSTKLRIEHHTITIHYLSNKSFTSFPAASLVLPGALRRYRNSKGSFTLSWKILMDKLHRICDFDESRHVLCCARGGDFAARVLHNERGLNGAFREQIAWFKESKGPGDVVFWALRECDLEVQWDKRLEREVYLEEAGEEVSGEDGGKSKMLVQAVGSWSEGVVEEGRTVWEV